MAEIELDAQGEGSRNACYCDEGMSPPACHAVLSCRQLSRKPGCCSMIETSKQNPTLKIGRTMQ
jgi:hypothetical protein